MPTICPTCGTAWSVQLDKVKIQGHPVRVRCSCGNSFSVSPELRRAYRRETNLSGTYTKLSEENEHGGILIKNVSMTGVAFKTLGDHCLSEADKLTLRITFDDSKHTQIEVLAVVIHVRDRLVGCEFKEVSGHEEDELASYLMLIP